MHHGQQKWHFVFRQDMTENMISLIAASLIVLMFEELELKVQVMHLARKFNTNSNTMYTMVKY